jgi:hypothetical protein
MPELTYWIADWNLTRAEASMLLGGGAVNMLDCIGGDADSILDHWALGDPCPIAAFGAYVTGSSDIRWTAEQIRKADRIAPVIAIDQSDGNMPVSADAKLIKDDESGAATNTVAVEVAKERLNSGHDYTIYISRANLGALEAAVARAGLPAGEIVGYQYTSADIKSEALVPGTDKTVTELNCDLSVVKRSWLTAKVAKKAGHAPMMGHAESVHPEHGRVGTTEIITRRAPDGTWSTSYTHGPL